MDVESYIGAIKRFIKRHWFLLLLVSLFLLFGIPFIIDKMFNTPAIFSWLSVHYNVGEVLSFYGTVLGGSIGGVAALLAVFFTVKYYTKKDSQAERNAVYEKQLAKINKVVDSVCNRDVINYDQTLALGFSKELLLRIVSYNRLVWTLRGDFTESGMRILNLFQREYEASLGIDTRVHMSDSTYEEEDIYSRRLSVGEFLSLKPELRQCIERIGHLALYDNACDLMHSDPTLAYILQTESGGSGGLWAAQIHMSFYNDEENTETGNIWEEFRTLVRELLIKLDEYKNSEYNRIVTCADTSIVPRYYIKRDDSTSDEVITVEEYKPSNRVEH